MRSLIFGFALALGASSAHAATFYTNSADWLAALGADAATLTLDDFGADVASGALIMLGSGVTSEAIGGVLPSNRNEVAGGELRLATDGTGTLGPLLTRFEFPAPITALAFDFNSLGQFVQIVGDFDGTGGQAAFPNVEFGGDVGFFGLIGTAGFDSLVFESTGGNDNFSLDNLAFGSSPPLSVIPVPASLPLLIGGFGALALMRRQKKV